MRIFLVFRFELFQLVLQQLFLFSVLFSLYLRKLFLLGGLAFEFSVLFSYKFELQIQIPTFFLVFLAFMVELLLQNGVSLL